MSTIAPDAPSTPQPGGMLSLATTDDVASLARARHPMSLSLLMATTPADAMRAHDRTHLQALVRDAHRRLLDEPDQQAAAEVRIELAAAVDWALRSPTDRGLAILVSPVAAHHHHLRVTPRDRIVLDPTFATRDLVRSAAEDPPFLMLVIDGRAARLFHYDQRYSRPILDHDFPMVRDEDTGRDSVQRARQERTRAFLRTVIGRLAARATQPGMPVVLVAPERLVAEFQAQDRSRQVAAVVRTGDLRVPLIALEEMARDELAAHVSDRAAAALDTVRVRLAHDRAVAGLAAAWQALAQGEPDLLVVERSHAPAVRLSDSGIEVTHDAEEHGVIDDAVDDLIEAALIRGAEVVMVPDGALAQHGRVVLSLRGRVRGQVD
ncbi:MAG: hypothetical protein WCF36_12315 [Candidatus Nanopelagicales bacterium]